MKRLISFLATVIMGLILLWVISHDGSKETEPEKKYHDLIQVREKQIDSLNRVIAKIQGKRYLDSLLAAMRISAKDWQIDRLTNNVPKVNFKEYSDPQLDSLLDAMYPDSLRHDP